MPVCRNSQVILVEDDHDLADTMRDNLLAEGCHVDLAYDGNAALELARGTVYDLMILDVMLPGRDGFSVCEILRREGQTLPILFLTARGTPDDRIRGLEVGGDDYLTKPFRLRELLLRVHALLRRGSSRSPAPTVHFGDNSFNLETGLAVAWDGVQHHLSGKEAEILVLFIGHENELLSRDDILEEVWRQDVFPSSRSVDWLVNRLRHRFERDPERPRHLHPVPGEGYRFTREPQAREV